MPFGQRNREDRDVLLEISLRLKAARYLAGRRSEPTARSPQGRSIAIPVEELAANALLVTNGITKNRLDEYETMRVPSPRPMELEQIARALGVPAGFISAPLRGGDSTTPLRAETAEELLDELRAATRTAEQLLSRLGQHVSRRALQSRSAADRLRKAEGDGR